MDLLKTKLHALHQELGAKMVPFAGYEMPVQYPAGLLEEHKHTRTQAGLFDVSHMGQFVLEGPGITEVLERLVPVDLQNLGNDRMTYALLMNEQGGVRDDLMITRLGAERFLIVANAACKNEDREWIEAHLSSEQSLRELRDHGLLAVQGPASRAILGELLPKLQALPFMHATRCDLDGIDIYASCSGYTGEDGYELSIAPEHTESVARRLLEFRELEPVGLGARDSLRLEVGLCLYGHELADDISPIEAKLLWSISPARRPNGVRAGSYPGADVVAAQIKDGVNRVRVGLVAQGKRPLRDGQVLKSSSGEPIGQISSGAFSPALEAPVAMGFIDADMAKPGTELLAEIRGKQYPVTVEKLPLVSQRYFRG
ncbi:MAG: glycine cleavage system aminomethyltransferase GcvT [Pseudomonadota bacterium]